MAKRFLLQLLLPAAALTLATGCATTLHVRVDTSADTNQGRPIYMLIRSVDGQALVSEDYDEAAARVFALPADPTVKKVQAILPGQTVNLSMPRPEEGALALYFFFTNPGSKWRVPLEAPLPTEVIVELGENNIRRVRVRRK